MSVEQLRALLEEAARDETLRQRLLSDPSEAVSGYELTVAEQDALQVLTSRGDDFSQVLRALFSAEAAIPIAAPSAQDAPGAAGPEPESSVALRRLLTIAAASEIIALPHSRLELLRQVLETAGRVLGARAGSLFLLDERAEELTFEVAIGPEADKVQAFRVPLGQGIAGWSAATGQALAVAEVAQDARFFADIGQAIGYMPRCILCVPLIVKGRVLGVLELLDRFDGEPFSQADIDLGSLFANEAAIAIDLSETLGNHARLLGSMLQTLGVSGERSAELELLLEQHLSAVQAAEPYREAVGLASLVARISEGSPAAAQLCRRMLEAVAAYLAPDAALM